jgi:hypothetical protein
VAADTLPQGAHAISHNPDVQEFAELGLARIGGRPREKARRAARDSLAVRPACSAVEKGAAFGRLRGYGWAAVVQATLVAFAKQMFTKLPLEISVQRSQDSHPSRSYVRLTIFHL